MTRYPWPTGVMFETTLIVQQYSMRGHFHKPKQKSILVASRILFSTIPHDRKTATIPNSRFEGAQRWIAVIAVIFSETSLGWKCRGGSEEPRIIQHERPSNIGCLTISNPRQTKLFNQATQQYYISLGHPSEATMCQACQVPQFKKETFLEVSERDFYCLNAAPPSSKG